MVVNVPWPAFAATPSCFSISLVFPFSPTLYKAACIYFFFAFTYIAYRFLWRQPKDANMARSPFVIFNGFLLAVLTIVYGLPNPTAAPGGTATSTRVEPTLPASVQDGQNLLPNIYDPRAINPQSVCPGYIASNVVKTSHGMTADLGLAGAACNVYGTDIDNLKLTVEFQSRTVSTSRSRPPTLARRIARGSFFLRFSLTSQPSTRTTSP